MGRRRQAVGDRGGRRPDRCAAWIAPHNNNYAMQVASVAYGGGLSGATTSSAAYAG